MKKEALVRIIKSYRASKEMADKLYGIFGNADKVESISWDLLDAVWYQMGENTQPISESVSYRLLNSDLPDNECAEILYEYMNRVISQPRPVFFSEEEQKEMDGYIPIERR